MWIANLRYGESFGHLDSRGTFGDQFGAVNALFTGLAFAGVIYAIFLQRHEVELLHEELEKTKEILKQQEELAASQLDAQRKQIFEGTFFQMLSLFNGIVSSMDLVGVSGNRITGKDVFRTFVREIKNQPTIQAAIMYPEQEVDAGKSEAAYETVYKKHVSDLAHYFRVLYNLYKFVDESGMGNKKFYTNILRAQLSDDEATILFLNGLTDRGEKFKPLLEKYTVLKNVNRDDVVFKFSRGRDRYAPSAFE